uniref:Uncharacterized protein n=1 Tax=viral metagenome TaxID=1070528 RepID=A0A6C0CZG2_9ZZZZ
MDFIFQSSVVFLHHVKEKWVETWKEKKTQETTDIIDKEEEDNGYGFYIDMEDIRDLEEEEEDDDQKEKEKLGNIIKHNIKLCMSGVVSMASVLFVGEMLQVYGRMSPFGMYSFYVFYTMYSTFMLRLVWTSPKK